MTNDVAKSHVNLRWVLALLLVAWLLPGVLGRDPWKADECYTYGLVQHILDTGDYLAPTLAGEPFMQKPPLLFSVAAVCVKLFTPLLSVEDAARVAVLIFLGLILLTLALATREMLGPGKGWLGALMFMGAIGQFHISHMLITDVALVAGFAITIYGLMLWPRSPKFAGFVTGTGMGVAFMSKGLLGPGVLGLTMIALPVCFRAWRSRSYFLCLAIGAVVSLPWVLIWPWLVYQRSPELFHQWFWDNNLGRFLGASTLGLDNKIGMPDERYYGILHFPWYAFPATLVGAWALWKKRAEVLSVRGVQLSLVCTFILVGIVTASRNGRDLYMLPGLAPVALLGAWGMSAFSGTFSRRVRWFCFIAFGAVFAASWLGWIAQMTGQPAALWAFIHGKLPDLTPRFQFVPFAAALLFSVLWVLWMMRQKCVEGSQSLITWTAGLAGVYLFLMTLWLPAMESRMSYAHLASIKDVLPPDHGPIASLNVGEPQRGMFDFYAGVKTKRLELGMRTYDRTITTERGEKIQHVVEYPECKANWFLTERELFNKRDPEPPGGPWRQVWESTHSGKELFRLYKRTGPATTADTSGASPAQ